MSGVTMLQGAEAFPFSKIVEKLMSAAKWPQPLLYDHRYVMEKVLRREWQLWLLLEDDEPPPLMMVTWVAQLPAGKMCFVELVCGEGLIRLLEKGAVFDNWCKFEQIDLIQATTRKEIAHFMAHAGWSVGNTSIYRWTERVQ